MATQEKPPATRKPAYEMPKPPLGLVHWFHALGSPPVPAIVTAVGRTAVAVALIPPESRVVLPKDAVLHVSDPRARNADPEYGLWDFTPEHKQLLALVEGLGGAK